MSAGSERGTKRPLFAATSSRTTNERASRSDKPTGRRASPPSPAAKGGVGKTFITANLAAAGWRGERVLVLDADLGLANLDVVLNLYPQDHAARRSAGRVSLEDAIVPAPAASVLLAGSGMVEYSRMTPEVGDKLRALITAVRPRYDHVLLDTGAGISPMVLFTISLARGAGGGDARAHLAGRCLRHHEGAGHHPGRCRFRLGEPDAQDGEGRQVGQQLQQVVDRLRQPSRLQPTRLERG